MAASDQDDKIFVGKSEKPAQIGRALIRGVLGSLAGKR
jgi:hypothetical protein